MPTFFPRDAQIRAEFTSETVLAFLQQELTPDERERYLKGLMQNSNGVLLFAEVTGVIWPKIITEQRIQLKVTKEVIHHCSQWKLYELESKRFHYMPAITANLEQLCTMMINGERSPNYEALRQNAISDFGLIFVNTLYGTADKLLDVKQSVLKNLEWMEQSLQLWMALEFEQAASPGTLVA